MKTTSKIKAPKRPVAPRSQSLYKPQEFIERRLPDKHFHSIKDLIGYYVKFHGDVKLSEVDLSLFGACGFAVLGKLEKTPNPHYPKQKKEYEGNVKKNIEAEKKYSEALEEYTRLKLAYDKEKSQERLNALLLRENDN